MSLVKDVICISQKLLHMQTDICERSSCSFYSESSLLEYNTSASWITVLDLLMGSLADWARLALGINFHQCVTSSQTDPNVVIAVASETDPLQLVCRKWFTCSLMSAFCQADSPNQQRLLVVCYSLTISLELSCELVFRAPADASRDFLVMLCFVSTV